MRHGYFSPEAPRTRTVRGGHVIRHYPAYLRAQQWGESTIWWIVRGDADFAAQMARQAAHAAGKALGHP